MHLIGELGLLQSALSLAGHKTLGGRLDTPTNINTHVHTTVTTADYRKRQSVAVVFKKLGVFESVWVHVADEWLRQCCRVKPIHSR